MSSSAVRAEFNSALATTFPAVGIFETLGVRTNNNTLPDLWMTTDFMSGSDNAISLGNPACWRELGVFRTYVVGKTGQGASAVLAQADLVSNAFRKYSDATGNIRVLNAVPPAPSEESDGKWIVVSVDFNFRNDHAA